MREVLLSECIDLLYESHFVISKPFGRSCFDLIAKKADLRFLIKILKNIDSLSTEQSEELLNIAKMLQARITSYNVCYTKLLRLIGPAQTSHFRYSPPIELAV